MLPLKKKAFNEGAADTMAFISLLRRPSESPRNKPFPMFAYLARRKSGARNQVYTSDKSGPEGTTFNAVDWSDYDEASSAHKNGEIWAMAMWVKKKK